MLTILYYIFCSKLCKGTRVSDCPLSSVEQFVALFLTLITVTTDIAFIIQLVSFGDVDSQALLTSNNYRNNVLDFVSGSNLKMLSMFFFNPVSRLTSLIGSKKNQLFLL